ncbi:hypothetical protein Enr13x_51530 [Stieleria neptunia]|uniref:Uncharacterized protein n=1 Tax=Stieleria neptunia TaxID=2527979 RepID=A0A518HX05_9BACT|nr:hypothetical protein Enr13x_51530 [Stieleria neptunia]
MVDSGEQPGWLKSKASPERSGLSALDSRSRGAQKGPTRPPGLRPVGRSPTTSVNVLSSNRSLVPSQVDATAATSVVSHCCSTGQRTMDNERWTTNDGQRTMDNERWARRWGQNDQSLKLFCPHCFAVAPRMGEQSCNGTNSTNRTCRSHLSYWSYRERHFSPLRLDHPPHFRRSPRLPRPSIAHRHQAKGTEDGKRTRFGNNGGRAATCDTKTDVRKNWVEGLFSQMRYVDDKPRAALVV